MRKSSSFPAFGLVAAGVIASTMIALAFSIVGNWMTGQAATFAGAERARTFFAFERELWLEAGSAVLEMERPERYARNPVIPRGEGDAPDSHRVGMTSLLPQGDRLRAWYGAMSSGSIYTGQAIAYAESRDGFHWTKPNLGVVEGTNLILPEVQSLTVDAGGPGYVGAADFFRPDVGRPGAESGATFEFVTSVDGFQWDMTRRPATNMRHFEIYGLFHRGGRWWILGQGVIPYTHGAGDGLPHRVMYGFHSEDGKDFSFYPHPLFTYPGNPFFPQASVQNHTGAGVWDRGRVLLGMVGQLWPSAFSSSVAFTIGLIYSYDGIDWKEPFSQTPFLMTGASRWRTGIGETESWDSGWLMPVQRPVSRGRRTFIYYTGSDGGNEWSARSALGLALIRRDGFASYRAPADGAELTTRKLRRRTQDRMLYLNSSGEVTVQLLDGYLRPVAPSVDISRDGVRTPALGLDALEPGSEFHLRFRLGREARLYSFSLGPSEDKLPPLEEWE